MIIKHRRDTSLLKSGTLTAHYAKSINSTLDEPVVISIGGGQMIATSNGVEAFYQNQEGDVFTGEVMHTLRAGAGAGRRPMVREDTGVRRLTPLECERLQGFPDNWTEGQSDSQRYRQMGNSLAIPVVEWIAHRLADCERAAT